MFNWAVHRSRSRPHNVEAQKVNTASTETLIDLIFFFFSILFTGFEKLKVKEKIDQSNNYSFGLRHYRISKSNDHPLLPS